LVAVAVGEAVGVNVKVAVRKFGVGDGPGVVASKRIVGVGVRVGISSVIVGVSVGVMEPSGATPKAISPAQ